MKRVFVIDDEPDMTMVAEHALTRRGYRVTVSNEPRDGLARLLAEPVDAVVVDLMMPGLNGLSLIARLRDSELHRDTPIIVLSAKRLEDSERKLLLEHGVRFVQKPLTPARLVQVVGECTTRAGTHSPSEN